MDKEARNTEDWRVVSARIGEVIQRALQEKKMTVQTFAREMGFSQPAVSSVLNPKVPNRCWSGPMLLAAARALGIKVSDIFHAVESGQDTDDFLVWVVLGVYPPHSDERLVGLIRWCVPKGTSEDVKKTFYTVEMMDMGFKDLVKGYRDGQISDSQMLGLFRAAMDADEDKTNLWAALRKYRDSAKDSFPG